MRQAENRLKPAGDNRCERGYRVLRERAGAEPGTLNPSAARCDLAFAATSLRGNC
jgi:hypothetical protein